MDIPFRFPIFNNSRVHLAVCGSVAAYKSLDLMRVLIKQGIHTSVSLTASGSRFIPPLNFSALGAAPVYGELFSEQESPYDHLLPGQVCDAFALVPASANTIAKIANGVSDTMVTAQALAFDKPLIFAPAMNPKMWYHPSTVRNVATLRADGHGFVLPELGAVACGEHGVGKLASIDTIYWHILRAVAASKQLNDLSGKKVMVTLGPTREQWDGVRYWSNLSTGHMGVALATAAWLRGAEVFAVHGSISFDLPAGITRYPVLSASGMFEAASSLWEHMDYGIFSAAVADFAPKPFGMEKFKKSSSASGFSLEFTPNKDILATLGERKQAHQRIVGFAAETSNVLENAKDKLVRKNADIIVGNKIGDSGSGFGAVTNDAFIVKNADSYELPRMEKSSLAWLIMDELCAV